MFFYFTLFFIIALALIITTFVIIPNKEEGIVERFGKYNRTLKPGFHFLIPLFDKIAYKQDTREQVIDIPLQSCITKDNIQVEVDGVIYIRIVDIYKASYGIDDYILAAINMAMTTMRSEIGKISLDESFSERDKINNHIVLEIDKASEDWGIKVLRYEIKNISLSENIMNTLEKQMESERNKRADITIALAQKESSINIAEGEKISIINESEGLQTKRILLAKAQAYSIETVAEAEKQGYQNIIQILKKENGSIALEGKLMQLYSDTLANILANKKVLMLPKSLSEFSSLIKTFSKVNKGDR